jgi:cellulose synthase/poly-beta-1,6-N-acetylglucosamine synthase-like glycosyltransferase
LNVQPVDPTLSVIVPVYNGSKTIRECLDALFASSFREFEVIVVDDGSDDGAHRIVAEYPCQTIAQANAGPGAARNAGARAARGQILFFLDADILVKPDSLAQIVATFAARPDVGALFGSFGTHTTPGNFVTVYKNLQHHYTHQTASENAATFCGGFGAVRRQVFESIGGFHPPHRFLEDIEIGYRLHVAGVAILLCKEIQFTHCKHYTLRSLVLSDLHGRAVPWTRLMLAKRLFRNDLNTRTHNVLSVPCAIAIPLAILPALLGHPVAAVVSAMLLVGVFAFLNRDFLSFLARTVSVVFALRAMPLLWLGYLYSALGVAIGVWHHVTGARREDYAVDSSRELERIAAEDAGLR